MIGNCCREKSVASYSFFDKDVCQLENSCTKTVPSLTEDQFTNAQEAIFLTYATGVCPVSIITSETDTKTQIAGSNIGTLFEDISS